MHFAMKLNIIITIIILISSIVSFGQEDQENRKKMLNFALLLKHKKNKSIEEHKRLNELYIKLGYPYLAADNYINLAKSIRDEQTQRKLFQKGDSLNKLPYKKMYAKSYLYQPAPDFIVEQWISDEPNMEGKFVLIDFWATWCGPCKRAIPKLNEMHKAFQDKLVVVGVSDEKAEKVRNFSYPPMDYSVAIDQQKRMFSQLQIRGIPHVIILDPNKKVIWEGFPLNHLDPLTKEKVEELLKIFE